MLGRLRRGALGSLAALATCSLAAAPAACGGDDDGPMAPQNADVAGNWAYNATNLAGTLSGVGISCTLLGTTLSLTQTVTTFSGTYSGGEIGCSGGGQSFESGNTVTFDFDTQDWRNTGSVSGNSMSGTVLVRVDLGDQVVTLNGNWAAGRQTPATVGPAVPAARGESATASPTRGETAAPAPPGGEALAGIAARLAAGIADG